MRTLESPTREPRTLEPRPLSVLVVDDSAVARQVMTTLLCAAGMKVQVAHDPLFALQKLERWEPDVLVLDIEMPRMDGLSFLKILRKERRDTPVVICSGATGDLGDKALLALDEGAAEVVTKPQIAVRDFLYESAVVLVDAVLAAAQTRKRFKPQANGTVTFAPRPRPNGRIVSRTQVLAVGASTGGPEAIKQVLSALPADAPPTLIVQHMPEGFTKAFAARLDRDCPMRVREARSGDRLETGLALLAPGGRHLVVQDLGQGAHVCVVDGPLVSRHRPSVDMLFESVAATIGSRAVGVLLTGMGDDGARGIELLKRAGAFTLAQDEASSVVFGMPKAAVDTGAVDKVVPLDRIGEAILMRC
jgi:two-component system, chemotaxis family, protein-glutamate methylesterase/glutaminase